MYNYFSPDGNAPTPKKMHWLTESTDCPIYLDGEEIAMVKICFDYADSFIPDTEFEVSDIRYGSIDGILMPCPDDIYEVIHEFLNSTKIVFEDKLTHEPKL